MLSALACLTIIHSQLPLVATILLLPLVIKYTRHLGWFVPSLTGEVTFISPREYQTEQGTYVIKAVLFPLMSFGLLIVLANNQRVLMWRDSMPESSYRQLVVMLKREH
nr:protein YgfX [Vibrio salilacus]